MYLSEAMNERGQVIVTRIGCHLVGRETVFCHSVDITALETEVPRDLHVAILGCYMQWRGPVLLLSGVGRQRERREGGREGGEGGREGGKEGEGRREGGREGGRRREREGGREGGREGRRGREGGEGGKVGGRS